MKTTSNAMIPEPGDVGALPGLGLRVWRYGLAALLVTVVVALKLEFIRRDLPFPFTSFSLAAVAISCWWGGTGPALLAVAVTSLALTFWIPPQTASGFALPAAVINHVFLALMASWIVSSRRRTDRLLVQARGELEAKVIERTARLQMTNAELQSEVLERKRAEQALRASEQVVRGQAEALIHSLDVLATVPAPDRFIGQMLSAIGRLLEAQSVDLWLMDVENDLTLRAHVPEADAGSTAARHPMRLDPELWKRDLVVQETLARTAPLVIEDLQTDARVSPQMRTYYAARGTAKELTIPILRAGHAKGLICICHDARPTYRPEEIELAQALAHQVMLAIQLTEFAEQRKQAAVLEERNRIARDIHDTLAQGFTGVIVQLEAAEDALGSGLMDEAIPHLHRAADLARQSLTEARGSVRALRPQALQEATFWEVLRRNISKMTSGTQLLTEFELEGRIRELPATWQENLLRIGQETLTNTLKHAQATLFIARLTYADDAVRLDLKDNGQGFDVNANHDGFGLAGMKERVAQMGGTLAIRSERGGGATLLVTLPYSKEVQP